MIIEFGLTPATLKVVKEIWTHYGGRIMATLQEIKDATRQNGEQARAAIDRVAADVQALQAKIEELQALLEAGDGSAEELAQLKAGLDEVLAMTNETTGLLTGLDPVP